MPPSDTASPKPSETSPGDRRRVLSAAGLVGSLTVLSRVLGLGRDALMTRALGNTTIHSVFLIAFEIPNLARRVLGEGSLSAFIVPVFTRTRAEHGEAHGWRFANNALLTMAVFTGILTLVGWFGAQWLFIAFGGAAKIVHGAPDAAEVIAEGTRLVRIMIPFLMLLAVAAMMMGLLHSLGHFLAPALGSIVLNVLLIAICVWAFGWPPEQIVTALAWGVVAAAVLRIVVMIPPLRRRGWRWRPVFNPRSDGMVRLYAMMLPAAYGLGIAQLNISIDKILAFWIDDRAVAYLNYSNRLTQFPLAIFASALATAMLPTLSRRLTEGDLPALRQTMNMSLRLGLLIFAPAMVGLMVLSGPICAVLYEGGRFDAEGTRQTAWALIFYAAGMLAFAAHRLLTPLYYAREDLRTPIKAAAISMAVNIVLNLVLMNTPLRLGGLALATSCAAMVNAWLLIRWLRLDLRGVIDRGLMRLFGEVVILSAVMGVACRLAWVWVAPWFAAGSWGLRAMLLSGLIALGLGVVLAGAKALRVRELDEALRLLRRR